MKYLYSKLIAAFGLILFASAVNLEDCMFVDKVRNTGRGNLWDLDYVSAECPSGFIRVSCGGIIRGKPTSWVPVTMAPTIEYGPEGCVMEVQCMSFEDGNCESKRFEARALCCRK